MYVREGDVRSANVEEIDVFWVIMKRGKWMHRTHKTGVEKGMKEREKEFLIK